MIAVSCSAEAYASSAAKGRKARVIRPGYALFEDVVWMVSRGVRSRQSPERGSARGEQGHAATSGGLKR